jgi:hypothetical protein
MGLISTQWIGTFALVCGQLAEIASCPQGLVDTIGRLENGPAYAN